MVSAVRGSDAILNPDGTWGGVVRGRAWRIVVVVALGLLAIAAAWWVTMWGVPPWTLEGAWMYAILHLAGAGSLALSLTLRRGR